MSQYFARQLSLHIFPFQALFQILTAWPTHFITNRCRFRIDEWLSNIRFLFVAWPCLVVYPCSKGTLLQNQCLPTAPPHFPWNLDTRLWRLWRRVKCFLFFVDFLHYSHTIFLHHWNILQPIHLPSIQSWYCFLRCAASIRRLYIWSFACLDM